MSSVDWREAKYSEVFEMELRGLWTRRQADPNLDRAEIEGTLQHLYIQEGSDWQGRGEVGDIVMAATIAAFERFLSEWTIRKQTGAAS